MAQTVLSPAGTYIRIPVHLEPEHTRVRGILGSRVCCTLDPAISGPLAGLRSRAVGRLAELRSPKADHWQLHSHRKRLTGQGFSRWHTCDGRLFDVILQAFNGRLFWLRPHIAHGGLMFRPVWRYSKIVLARERTPLHNTTLRHLPKA